MLVYIGACAQRNRSQFLARAVASKTFGANEPTDMPGILESLRSTTRRLGWVNGLIYGLAQGLARVSAERIRIIKYHLVVQPIRDGICSPAHRGRDIEVREATPGDDILRQIPRPPETIAARFQQGARCLVAIRHGELAGFLWWIEGPYQEDEVRCLFVPEPAKRAVWDFDILIPAHFRWSPVFSSLWTAASSRLFAAGYRYTCSRISAFSPESLAAHRRLGAKVIGQRLFICIGRLQATFGNHTPRIHLSLSHASRPSIRVGP